MLKNYIKVAIRNLARNKIYSLINIFGLTLGITVFTLLYLFVDHELSFNSYNTNYDRTYRIYEKRLDGSGQLVVAPEHIVAENPDDIVIGMFWSSAVIKKTIFIDRSEVPYNLTPIEMITEDCRWSYPNASTEILFDTAIDTVICFGAAFIA